jgi:hypothetical protein
MDVVENPERSKFLLFDTDGYDYLPGDEAMNAVDAEEAICFELLRENDSLSRPVAKQLAADLIRNGRNLHIVISANGRQRHYLGGDPFLGRRPLSFCCC